MFANDLSFGLSYFRRIEHQIDLLLGGHLPNKRCNPNELKELQ